MFCKCATPRDVRLPYRTRRGLDLWPEFLVGWAECSGAWLCFPLTPEMNTYPHSNCDQGARESTGQSTGFLALGWRSAIAASMLRRGLAVIMCGSILNNGTRLEIPESYVRARHLAGRQPFFSCRPGLQPYLLCHEAIAAGACFRPNRRLSIRGMGFPDTRFGWLPSP
ncbi:hypothetical protein CALVIDRAFT_417656 [Calocera viscosa TUFC12733]|uniref:Uncharacterized protein n=1 Tax=Calocera viscosa (strain TUFC12733) TaxID=1330018 RepID=A0A167PGD0_CALVF|nr:hypothetical protein CALVIDRAFT_417656 [Calocera viscosa TUFC12733]